MVDGAADAHHGRSVLDRDGVETWSEAGSQSGADCGGGQFGGLASALSVLGAPGRVVLATGWELVHRQRWHSGVGLSSWWWWGCVVGLGQLLASDDDGAAIYKKKEKKINTVNGWILTSRNPHWVTLER